MPDEIGFLGGEPRRSFGELVDAAVVEGESGLVDLGRGEEGVGVGGGGEKVHSVDAPDARAVGEWEREL